MRQMRWELRGKKGRGRTAIAGEKEMGLLGTGRVHSRTVLDCCGKKGARCMGGIYPHRERGRSGEVGKGFVFVLQ